MNWKRTKAVALWLCMNGGLAWFLYSAIFEQSVGWGRVYCFFIWVNCIGTLSLTSDRAMESRKEALLKEVGDDVPHWLSRIYDLSALMILIYHGWWISGIAVAVQALSQEVFYDKLEKMRKEEGK